MVYLPNIGYVLAINEWHPTPPEVTELPDLEFKFSINGVHYYKSSSAKGVPTVSCISFLLPRFRFPWMPILFVVELDETVGDVILKITIRQNRILQKLTRYAKKHAGSIARTIERCAELDTYVSVVAYPSSVKYSSELLAMLSF